MKRIYKYALTIVGDQTIQMIEGAKVLSVQIQGENLCVWAMIDGNHVTSEKRRFEIFGTGHDIGHANRDYLGTVQQAGGALVWHVFERHP